MPRVDPAGRTFDEVPELYDRARPGYPDALFDDLAELAGLRPGARVLEIGCGTGQATTALVRRGYAVTAVERGPALARFTARKLPAVRVVNAAFEDWPPPAEPFDLVFAATAFHWLDPATRIEKSLRVGRALAVVATHHVRGGDAAFFAAAQRCYERWMPGTPPGLRLAPADSIPHDPELAGAAFRRYVRELTYSAREYLELLQTYSGHRMLDPGARARLLACIEHLIDARFGGRVTKRDMLELAVLQGESD